MLKLSCIILFVRHTIYISKEKQIDDVVRESRVMIMMSLLFIILFVYIFGKLAGFALRATWSIMKVVFFFIFLPFALVSLVLGGLLYVALPILVFIGIISLLANA